MPDRLSTRSDDSVLQPESNSINLVELLRQFSPRGYGVLTSMSADYKIATGLFLCCLDKAAELKDFFPAPLSF